MREREWRNSFILGKTPDQAAEAAQRWAYNAGVAFARMNGGRKPRWSAAPEAPRMARMGASKTDLRELMQNFISEDDLETFEGWLEYQGIDRQRPRLTCWKTGRLFDEGTQSRLATPKVGWWSSHRVNIDTRWRSAKRRVSGWHYGFGEPQRANFSSWCRRRSQLGS
jgi:hypothetical protein